MYKHKLQKLSIFSLLGNTVFYCFDKTEERNSKHKNEVKWYFFSQLLPTGANMIYIIHLEQQFSEIDQKS